MVGEHHRAADRYRGTRYRHALIAEERFAREYGDDVADQPQSDQNEDVHRGVRVEPEQKLVEKHLASHSRPEKAHSEQPLEQQHQEGHADELCE